MFALYFIGCYSKIINFLIDKNAIPNNDSLNISIKNTNIFNSIIYDLSPGDIFLIPNYTFYVMGGIQFSNLQSITFQINGILEFSKRIENWPRNNNKPVECFEIINSNNITFTSSHTGIFDGNGEKWWGIPFIGTLFRLENRPKLFHMRYVSNITIENILFLNSPYWTVHIQYVSGLVIRYSSIINKRTDSEKHSLIDLSAFNTDGFDIEGANVHIHDCYIWTQDDCIAVKGNSKNMLFENIIASGLGLTIGSIGRENVNNISFKNCFMNNTVKGIYIKFNGAANFEPGGSISNILYENITIINPSQYGIWIGPAQQADSRFICHPNPCSLCWPLLSPAAQCTTPLYGNFSNINLTNIKIDYKKSTLINSKYIGVLMAPKSNPMRNIYFNNVEVWENYTFNHPKRKYICTNINGIADEKTIPIPNCF